MANTAKSRPAGSLVVVGPRPVQSKKADGKGSKHMLGAHHNTAKQAIIVLLGATAGAISDAVGLTGGYVSGPALGAGVASLVANGLKVPPAPVLVAIAAFQGQHMIEKTETYGKTILAAREIEQKARMEKEAGKTAGGKTAAAASRPSTSPTAGAAAQATSGLKQAAAAAGQAQTVEKQAEATEKELSSLFGGGGSSTPAGGVEQLFS